MLLNRKSHRPLGSALMLVGDTLFISVYGQGEAISVDGASDSQSFIGSYRCNVPASLPQAMVVNSASTAGSIPTGPYAPCIIDYGYDGWDLIGHGGWNSVGGDLSLTVSESEATLTVMSDGGFPVICSPLAFDNVSGSTATLSDGQTCTVQLPCGFPSPLPDMSPAPSEATLTEMTGTIEAVGGVLFVNVVGNAPSEACGSHIFSLVCPTGP